MTTTKILIELGDNEWASHPAIERELERIERDIDNRCETNVVSEFIEKLLRQCDGNRYLNHWRLACIASSCASWAFHRGYRSGLDKGLEIGKGKTISTEAAL